MKSPREIVLSFLHPTSSVSHRVIGRTGIRVAALTSVSGSPDPAAWRHIRPLIYLFFAVTGGMAAYEWLKMLAFPGVTMWASYLMTIGVSGAAAVVAGYFVLQRQSRLLERMGVELRGRQRAEVTRKSEEKYRSLVSNIPDVVWTKDAQLHIVFTSPNIERISGYEIDEVYEQRTRLFLENIHPDDNQRVREAFEALFARGQPYDVECRLRHKNGEWIWVHDRALATYEKNGVRYADGLLSDITARKRAEEELHQSRRMLQSILDAIPQRIFWKDRNISYVGCNKTFANDAGLKDPAEILGKNDYELTSRETAERYRADDKLVMECGTPRLNFDEPQNRPDGSLVWLRINKLPLHDREGKVIGIIGTYEDITERKRAEQALQDSQSRLQAIVDSVQAGIVVIDPETHRIVDANSVALELIGAPRDQVVGAVCHKFICPEECGRCPVSDLNQSVDNSERVLLTVSGKRREIIKTVVPVVIAGRRHLLESFIDITGRKRAEAEMAEQHRLATLVAEVGVVLTRAESLCQGLQQCAEILVSNTGAAFARVWTVNEEENVLELQASAGMYTHLDGGHARVPLGKFKIGRIAERGEPHLTNSVQEDSWVGDPEWARREGMVAFAGHPLKVEDRVLGVLAAFARQPLTEATLQAFASVANNIAQFIKRKRAEATRDYLASIVEFSGDAIIGKTPEGVVRSWNAGAERLYGYTPSEMMGQSVFLLVPSEDRKEVEDFLNRVKRGEAIEPHETVRVTKGGRRIDVSVTISPLKSASGDVVGASTFARDITERKRAEQELLFKTALLKAQAETTLDGILVLDLTGHILLANSQFARMWSIPEEAIRTKDDKKLMEHSLGQLRDADAFLKRVNYLYTHASEKSRDEIELKDGRVFDRYSSPLQGSTGKLYGRIWYFRDITDRHELERMKSELVSVVSHELRTPLTSIRGALGLLAGGLLRSQPEKGERMLEIAVSNTDRLVRLINDILDLERMESGKMSMEKQTCNAADLMTQAVDSVRDLVEKAGVTLSVSLYSARLWVDPDRIIQALINLLGNAIKFSPRGGSILLSATPQAEQILFQVKDQGRGIPPEKREIIFERFQQIDASDRREKGGTGLGLPITRSIVQHHGGRIWVESALGDGSTFFFTLPFLPAETILVGGGSRARKVLVGAVNADICSTVQAVLNQTGYTVMVASSWQEVIDQATIDRPDAILLDPSLPGMESFEALTALKQKSHGEDVPVIGLGGIAPDKDHLAAVGMAGWVTKPLNEGSLFHALESVLGNASARPRVLVIEDDADLARVLTTIFERHGAVVFHARTGREAIQVCPQFVPDLLVLDVILPELDGFGVVEHLRQRGRWQHLPLAVYSVKELGESDKARLRLGESIFMTKSRLTPQEFEQRAIGLLNWTTSGQRERRRR